MSKKAASLDKLKHQLAEIDRLIADGTLKGDAARETRDRIERQILAHVTAGGGATAPAAAAAEEAPTRPSRGLLAAVVAFVVVFGAAGYAWRGNHEAWGVGPGSAPAEGGDASNPHAAGGAQIEEMVARLVQRLKDKPDDAEGWSMLARTYTAQGKHDEALKAYKRVAELRPQDAQALADYADGLAMVNNRNLEGEPEKLIAQALKLDPSNVKALALAGTVAFMHADYKLAAAQWEKAVASSDPQSEFTKQLQGALAEARQRGGMPPLADAGGTAPAATGGADGSAPAAAGSAVSGRIELKADVRAKVSPDDTVFIFARPATGSKMPLAILRRKVSDLPMDFRLDDSQAMSPATRLSTVSEVVVGARISKSGSAMPGPGDFEALSAPVKVGASAIRLDIGDPVR